MHIEVLLPFVAEYHAFEGIHMPDAARRAAVAPLLADDRLGSVWAISEDQRWIGYVALTWGYSIEMRGRDAFVDELFIREPHRGRGTGTRVLEEIKAHAAALGVTALHLEVDRGNSVARRFYAELGFESRDRFHLMTARLQAGWTHR